MTVNLEIINTKSLIVEMNRSSQNRVQKRMKKSKPKIQEARQKMFKHSNIRKTHLIRRLSKLKLVFNDLGDSILRLCAYYQRKYEKCRKILNREESVFRETREDTHQSTADTAIEENSLMDTDGESGTHTPTNDDGDESETDAASEDDEILW